MQLITWAQTTVATGHPRFRCTYRLLHERSRWPKMSTDIYQAVTFCSTCTQSKIALCPLANSCHFPYPNAPQHKPTQNPRQDHHPSNYLLYHQLLHLIPLPSLLFAFNTSVLLFTQVNSFQYLSPMSSSTLSSQRTLWATGACNLHPSHTQRPTARLIKPTRRSAGFYVPSTPTTQKTRPRFWAEYAQYPLLYSLLLW